MQLEHVVEHFEVPGRYLSHTEVHSGLINQTFLVTLAAGAYETEKMIFQKINTNVFKKPHEVMSNIINVTTHIQQYLLEKDGSYDRRVLDFVCATDGNPYWDDPVEGFWRAYHFVDNSVAYDQAPGGQQFFQAGMAFGSFQCQLADYDASNLFETIPNFHNTIKRVDALREAIDADAAGRRDSVRHEIDFLLARSEEAGTIVRALESGSIPYRVTHNDTKISNILFDTETNEAICVIDLDTIMPGSSLYDYGDAIRSGAATAKEDEVDLDKVHMDLEMYRLFTKGFIKGTHNLLTREEMALMPLGAKIMTYEVAVRFLTDYLNGDIYFRTSYPDQNLLRARTQIKLVADMEQKFDQMQTLADKYADHYAARYASCC